MTQTVPSALHDTLFQLGGRPVTPITLVVVTTIVTVAMLVSRTIRFILMRRFRDRSPGERGSMDAVSRLTGYALMGVGVVVALQTAGIDLGAVVAATAVFAVGIGLALQGIALNFVSGIVLLAERSIKVGDILEVNDQVVRVMELGIRSTRVRTLFEEDIILPNNVLVQQPIKNLTLHDSLIRIAVQVGVAYSSDLALVRSTLEAVARSMKFGDPEYEPVVILNEFGPSSVVYEASVWTHDPWASRRQRSEMREALFRAFAAKGIVIAAPQLEVRLVEPAKMAA